SPWVMHFQNPIIARAAMIRERAAHSRHLGLHQSPSEGEPMRIRTAMLALIAAPAIAFAQQGPTDPQIAAIVVTANNVDIQAGKMAKGKTHNKEVKAFAQQMITDHTAVNKQAGDLVKKLGVKPESNATSDSL